ncbi:MAG: indolepyruvate/phenylpyruvate decarboxylase [Thermoanaerobaculia bacterium]
MPQPPPKATRSTRRVRRPLRRPTLARFLLDQLVEAGVDRIYGIPGDFILRLCQVVEEYPGIDLLTMSHEPGVGFAAAGAARGREGIAVACVTYGAGALNMVNPVAAAYAEKTPVLVLTGGPGRAEREGGVLVHHQVKSFASQRRVFREVTHYQAVLDDPETAAERVRHAIDVCRTYSLPVYLEVPRDMVDHKITVGRPDGLEVPTEPGAVAEAAAEVTGKLARAERPVLVVGVEVHRFALTSRVVELAEALAVPVVTTFMGRGTFPDDHPQYAGTYLGPASPPGVREMVEESDCVVLLGALLSDTNMGLRLRAVDPRHLVLAVSRQVRAGHHRYDDVPLDELMEAMLRRRPGKDRPGARVPSRTGRPPFMRADDDPSEGPIRVAAMIAEINRFFAKHGEMPLVTDTGDCLFCSHQVDTQLVVASAYYATMGFGVPAAMGFQAASGRRPLVLVGDGGFQMTGWELLHARRWGVSPIVVVMNNQSWEMLQSFLPAGYNELPEGRFAETAAVWGMGAARAASAAGLRGALQRAAGHDGPFLIEVPLARGDISETLYTFTRSVGTTPPPE